MSEEIKAKYSIVIYNTDGENKSDLIKDCIKKGIKVILFDNLDGGGAPDYLRKIHNFATDSNAKFLYSRYEYDRERYCWGNDLPHYIADGEVDTWYQNYPMDYYLDEGETEEDLDDDPFSFWPPSFNMAQYKVEHASTNHKALIVKASAGTGKTKVMIDRIMFLLLTQPDLQLKDICMVTFTNDAANQMMERLQKRLCEYYSCTHDSKYIEMMEQLPSMNISTIDSLFKALLQKNGFALGYNKDTKIKNFTMERKYIVTKAVNQVISKENISVKSLPVYLYMLEALVLKLWNQMESKGYFYNENERRFWKKDDFLGQFIPYSKSLLGLQYINNTELESQLNTLIANALTIALKEYDDLTDLHNSLSLSDIRRKLLNVTDELKKQKQWKYIFVDEFQDTDDSQIQIISSLAKSDYCKQLFVVGDIKQSIYRFRGATDNAFEVLKKQIADYEEHRLTINYRTVATVQEKLDHILMPMATDESLFAKDDLAVESYLKKQGNVEVVRYPYSINNQADSAIQKPFLEKLTTVIKNFSNKRICILTRTNRQVNTVAKWCRYAGIPCNAKTSGNFYLSRPVTDLYCVLGYWLYPKNKVWKYNVSKTSFALVDLDIYSERLDTESLFKVIEDLICETRPWEKMPDSYWQAYYRMNLSKFLKMLYEQFSGEYVSLATFFSYIKIGINNPQNEESEIFPQVQNCSVEIMTVHKAKGMEWDIVFVPFTEDDIRYIPKYKDFYDFTFSKEKNSNIINIGWCLRKGKQKNQDDVLAIGNEKYKFDSCVELMESHKELARVLYVAITRCREQLYCFVPKETYKGFWSKWMAKGE